MSPLIRSSALAAAALLAVTAVTGCSADSGKGEAGKKGDSTPPSADGNKDANIDSSLPAGLTGQRLDWSECEAPSVAQGGGQAPGDGWECATMKAPLDYEKSDARTIDLALIRKKATNGGKRIGSLVYNFGGPGASGVFTLPLAAKDYTKLNSRYDLVSFDPRGVGNSAGVKCLGDRAMDELLGSEESLPENAADEKRLIAENERFAAACEKHSGTVLPHLTTENTARDMDLMRQVLGDEKLHYFGVSYGTELGGTYAHLFPKNVGHAVLDAVVDPTRGTIDSGIAQVKGFQKALTSYLESTGEDPKQGTEKIAKLLDRLESAPLPTNDGRKLNRGLATTGILSALYSEETWQYLTMGLKEAETGKGNTLLLLADLYNGRDPQGRYSTQQSSGAAISCADTSERFTLADVKERMPEYRKASPIFGEMLAWGLPGCSAWPVKGDQPHPEVSAAGAAPMVVIGNTGDPATPVEGAKKMARALGKGVGITLTVEGEGHGTYGVNSCATAAVDGYLLDGTVPEDGKTCS